MWNTELGLEYFMDPQNMILINMYFYFNTHEIVSIYAGKGVPMLYRWLNGNNSPQLHPWGLLCYLESLTSNLLPN